MKPCCFSLLLLFLSCGTSDDSHDSDNLNNTTPSSITIEALNSYTGAVNQPFQLTATVRNIDGDILENQTVIWASSDTSIAVIDGSGIMKIVSVGQVIIMASIGALEQSKSITIQLTPPNLIAFTIADLSIQLAAEGGNSLTFLDEPTMSGTYLELNIGETTTSTTANRDQVYYFYEGTGAISVDGESIVVNDQTAVYITANNERHINLVSTNMKVILIESASLPSEAAYASISYSYSEMEAPRAVNQNVWNPFLNENTMLFGLYMLPQTVGGDGALTHNWDELNIITSGSGRFQTDYGDAQVSPGSIVFVRESNSHSFNMLSSNLDILIFWNM